MQFSRRPICFLVLGFALSAVSLPDCPAAPAPAPKPREAISPKNVAKLRKAATFNKEAWRIVWRPDGREVAFVGWETPVEILGRDLKPVGTIGESKKIIHFAFHPDRERVAFCENGTTIVELLNVRTGKTTRLKAVTSQPGMTFSPDGKWLVTGGYGQDVRLWDSTKGTLVRTIPLGTRSGGLTCAFSPDSKILAVGNRNSTTGLFDVATGRLLCSLPRIMSHELKFHPNGKTLAVAYVDGSIALWDVASGKILHQKKAGASELYTLDWSRTGDLLVTAGLASQIVLWNPKDLSVLRKLDAPVWVGQVRFGPDGSQLLVAGGAPHQGGERKVDVWALP
jgi:WD40 repeat protein